MNERERIIRLWFDMWIKKADLKSLKEFGCNLHNYNPYRDSDIPVFREEKANWF